MTQELGQDRQKCKKNAYFILMMRLKKMKKMF